MGKNKGKKFEKNAEEDGFKPALETHGIYYKRYRDVFRSNWGGGGFKGGMKSSESAGDFALYYKPNHFLFELKTCGGTSFPLSMQYKYKDGKKIITSFGNIKYAQFLKMMETEHVEGQYKYYIIEMRHYNKLYAVSMYQIADWIDDLINGTAPRKSLSFDWFEENSIDLSHCRKVKSQVWFPEQQEFLLDCADKGMTGKEAGIAFLDEFDDSRELSTVKGKYYTVKSRGTIKPIKRYIRYYYDIRKILQEICEYENWLEERDNEIQCK